MRNVLAIGGIVLVICTVSTAGADYKDQEPFTVIGLGNTSCGAFFEAVEGERKSRPPDANPDAIYSQKYGGYLDFADGFFSGANYADAPPNRMIGSGTDHAGRMTWLENYCRQHPLALYGGALFAFRKQLEGH